MSGGMTDYNRTAAFHRTFPTAQTPVGPDDFTNTLWHFIGQNPATMAAIAAYGIGVAASSIPYNWIATRQIADTIMGFLQNQREFLP